MNVLSTAPVGKNVALEYSSFQICEHTTKLFVEVTKQENENGFDSRCC